MDRPDRTGSPFRALARLFGGAAGILLAGFLVAELLARLVAPVYLFNPDRARDVLVGERYARLRADQRIVSSTAGTVVDFTTNADGYRDLPFPRGHECLVLAFGNSFTVNWGVPPERAWPRLLEAELDADPATHGCAVRAVALQGWDLNAAYEAAHDLLPELRPELVLIMFTQMWTTRPPARRALGAEAPPLPERRGARGRLATAGSWLDQLRRVYNMIERHSALLGAVKRYVPYLPSNLGVGVLQAGRADAGLEPYREPTLATLEAFRALCEQIGAPMVLAVGPFIHEVDETYRYILLTVRGGTDRGLDSETPRKVLFAWAREHGVPSIDLLPALRAAHEQGWVYSPVDLHWNPRGNQVVARELGRQLAPLLARAR